MSFASTKRLAHLSVVTCSLAYAVAAMGCSSSTDSTIPEAASPAAGETGSGVPGGGEPGAPSPGGSPTPAQQAEGPHVLSSEPADHAKGVMSDAKIVIKFDRAMDTASVIDAYASMELPAEKVTFNWNTELDQLTITPNAPLEYAAGGPQIGANGYAVKLATSAKDKDGLPLAKDFSIAFSTLRVISTHAPNVAALSGRVLSNGAAGAAPSVGDYYSSGVERQAKAFLTFDLTSIPDDAVVEKAMLSIAENTIVGTPDASLGDLALHQVFFTAVDADAFSTEPVSGAQVGRITVLNGPAKRQAETTAMVKDDLANRLVRDNRTQVRLLFPTLISGDDASDFVSLDIATVDLAVQYLAP